MNALLNIQIRVAARAAQAQLAAIQKQTQSMNASNAAAAASASRVGSAGMPALRKWGSQLQWAGRQLTYNFTLPIAAAAGLATKFALDNEKAATRISKVYGDDPTKDYRKELEALGKVFRLQSDYYGVAQKDVLNIAADWAAAGVQGAALGNVVESTMKTMVLGEMNAADATKALIQIQAQYGMSSQQLSGTIAMLNMVENQTGTSMEDLIVTLSKSAGTARTAGLDIRHLAAMTAALVPAAGSAANAGNALKTIFSRILAPTKDAAEVMKLAGVNTEANGYASLNATQRLDLLGKAMKGATHEQRAQVTTLVAGRYQLNRFDILLRAMTSDHSYYKKALDATSSTEANMAQETKELNKVLQSNPQKFKQMSVQLQNMSADIIGPLIPLILAMANGIRKLVEGFTNLSPGVQKLIGTGLLLLAVLGPILRYMGAFAVLFSFVGKVAFAPLMLVVKLFMGIGKAVWGALQMVGNFAKVLGGVVWAVAKAAFNVLLAVAGTTLAAMRAAFTAALQTIGMMLRGAFWAMYDVIAAASRAMLTVVVSAFRSMYSLTLPIMGRMMGVIVGVVSAGVMAIVRTFLVMGAGLVAAWGRITVMLAAAWVRFTAITLASTISTLASGLMTAFMGIARGVLAIVTMMGRGILTAMMNPWVLAIVGVIILISAFRDKIARVWDAIVDYVKGVPSRIGSAFAPVVGFFQSAVNYVLKAFNALPEGVQNAILAVVRIVSSAAKQVYELFSYLNPFAHHSPSLVENVTGGMNIVRTEYSKTSKSANEQSKLIANSHKKITNSVKTANKSASTDKNVNKKVQATSSSAKPAVEAVSSQASGISAVDKIIKSATADLNKFKAMSRGLIPNEWADQIKAIKDQFPGLLPMFMQLIHDYDMLTARAAKMQACIDAQQKVVDTWKSKLDAANDALDRQQDKLDGLQKALDATQAQYDAASNTMQNFASSPIKGMQEFNDKIFANSLAQKKAQLQMAQWEKQNGSMDDLNSKFAALNGEIEQLSGETARMRAKGAGSDILGPMTDQIAALQAQADAVANTVQNSPVGQLQDQMDALAKQGEILQLQSDIKFDPMTHQIEKLANTTKELDYSTIINGIKVSRAEMNRLTPTINAQTVAVDRQKKVVAQATAARDAVQKRYDSESKKLDRLKEKYDKVADAISAVKDQLSAVSSAASSASSSAGGKGDDLSKSFAQAGKGDYKEYGGDATLGREGGMKEINQQIKDQQDRLGKQMGDFDMFKPVREGWKKGWAWVVKYLGPVGKQLGKGAKEAFKTIGDAMSSFTGSGEASALGNFFKSAFSVVGTTIKVIMNIVKLFWPELKKLFFVLGDMAKKVWNDLVPALLKFWNAIKPLVALVAVIFLGALKVLASMLVNTIGPAFDLIVDVLVGVMRVFGGLANVVVGVVKLIKDVVTLNVGGLWADLKQIFGGIYDVFVGTFMTIWKVIGGVVKTIWGVVSGFVKGIVGFFTWLYDVLVGHSIVPDLMKAIVKWFGWLLKPIGGILKMLWTVIRVALKPITGMFKLITAPIRLVLGSFKMLTRLGGGAFKLLGRLVSGSVKMMIGTLKRLVGAGKAASTAMKAVKGGNVGGGMASGASKAIGSLKALSKAGMSWVVTQGRMAASAVAAKAKLVAQTAATVVAKGVTLAIAAAQRIWAAAQWLLNAAMSANPIGLIVIAVLAVIAVIILVIKHWKSIWSVMKAVWGWISSVFLALWDKIKDVVLGVMSAVWSGIKAAGRGIASVFKVLWTVVQVLWNTVGKIVFEAIKTYIKIWVAIFTWVWKNVIKPAWDIIWSGIKLAWDNIAKPIFEGIKLAIQTYMGIFKWIWTNIIKPAWNAIWSGVKLAWNTVGKPIFDGIKSFIHGVGDVFTAIKDTAVRVFKALWGAIKDPIGAFKTSFQAAWDGIKKIFAAPIKFLISGVIDKGILGAWNWLARTIPGMGGLTVDEWHPTFMGMTFAEGGVLPGYAPGKDRIPAMLSPGEGVLVPEVVRALGANTIHKWNKEGVSQRGGGIANSAQMGGRAAFKDGGVLANLNPMEWLNKFKGKIMSLGGNIADHVSGDTGFGAKLLKVPGATIGKVAGKVLTWLKELPGKIVAKAWKAIKGWFGLDYDMPDFAESLHGLVYAKSQSDKAFIYKQLLTLHDNTTDNMKGLVASNPFHWIDNLNKNKDMGTGYAGYDYKWHSNKSGDPVVKDTSGKITSAILGTRNSLAGMHVVGENGPELLNLPYGSKVFNNSSTTRTIADVAGRVAARIAAPQQGSTGATVAGPVTHNTTNNRVTNIKVTAKFPGIKSADDAEEFVRQLEILSNKGDE